MENYRNLTRISGAREVTSILANSTLTYIHVGMYLLFSKSPYTEDQLMNYKSSDCYQNFANGWVQEVFVKKFGENRLLIAKVSTKTATMIVTCACVHGNHQVFSLPDHGFFVQVNLLNAFNVCYLG